MRVRPRSLRPQRVIPLMASISTFAPCGSPLITLDRSVDGGPADAEDLADLFDGHVLLLIHSPRGRGLVLTEAWWSAAGRPRQPRSHPEG
jgi:hypothetical protein